ncbi:hypothetical protein FACS1894137_15670 [Spirochaetia bacterium]|nr:hypothetical protein FACS1894137_15670 [Spirochaetia bacterium]
MELHFTEPPRIGNRSDALELLEQLLTAESVRGLALALTALKDAIERGIV